MMNLIGIIKKTLEIFYKMVYNKSIMSEEYLKCIHHILKWEGYKSNDPDDSGGRTVFGIAERFYPDEVEKMWYLPKERAKEMAVEIFYSDYWLKINGDTVDNPLYIFDTAVNMGVGYARGLIGLSLDDMHQKRVDRYIRISQIGNNGKFLQGWLNRANYMYAEQQKI